MKIVHDWLSELVDVPADVEATAREISLRGFEVASVESGVIDFEITANRPDCLSHLGIAREAAVIWGVPVRPPASRAATAADLLGLEVQLDAADLCPRYAAQVFDVRVGPSPAWLVRRLEAAGVRSINNVVDVTNYVMLELGQPMHGFDLDALASRRLVIRRGRAGETLRTLDGVDRTLNGDMVVIADAERATAIGGVMGGEASEIGVETRHMVLESACFRAEAIRGASRRLNLKTEASTRFERGGDVNAPVAALARAAHLLAAIGAAEPRGLVDVYPAPPSPRQVRLRASRIAHLLGLAVPDADAERYLVTLGFHPERDPAAAGTEWNVAVPTYRPDVTREVDLIEEVGRHHGFDRLPTTFPVLEAPPAEADARIERDRRVRAVLAAAGVTESMTFAFIEREAAAPFCDAGTAATSIANPLSEKFAVLRPSLLPGLIDSLVHNRRRGRKDVRLFETGARFTAAGERRAAGIVLSGAANAAHWSRAARQVDFFDVKGLVEVVCAALDATSVEIDAATVPYLVAGRTAVARVAGVELARFGQLDADVAAARGIPAGEDVYVAELDLDAIASQAAGAELRTTSLPKYPAITRDLSILVDEALPAAAVRGTIRSAGPAFLDAVDEFDRYQGKGIPDGSVSLSLRLVFRSPERTLTDAEVDAAMQTIVAALEGAHGARRR